MINSFRTLTCLILGLPLLSSAQSPLLNDLAQDLEGKVVYLRPMYVENNLAFDAQGNVIGAATPGPFSVSLIKIDKVRITGTALDITGHRGTFIPRDATAVPVFEFLTFPEKVHIQIAADPAHPEALQPLVNKILATSLADALAGKTSEEQKSAMNSLPSLVPLPPLPADPPSSSAFADASMAGVMKDRMPGVQSPRLIYSVNPDFAKARDEKIWGIVVLTMIIDRSGYPTHIRVRRPVDPGLNRNAIVAVTQWRFAPGIYQNRPVPVEVNIEVNYRP
jgi:TonB family protein